MSSPDAQEGESITTTMASCPEGQYITGAGICATPAGSVQTETIHYGSCTMANTAIVVVLCFALLALVSMVANLVVVRRFRKAQGEYAQASDDFKRAIQECNSAEEKFNDARIQHDNARAYFQAALHGEGETPTSG